MFNSSRFDLRKAIMIVLIVLLVAAALYGVYRLTYYFAPFIIAFIVSSLLEPVIRLLMKRIKLSRKAAAPITLLLLIIPLGAVITLIILKLVSEIKSFTSVLPESLDNINETVSSMIAKGTEIYNWLPKEVTVNIDNVVSNLSSYVISISESIGKGIVNTAISIPQALIFIIITILATYFITSDRDKILNYFTSNFPKNWVDKFIIIKNAMFSGLFGYLRAQLILMSITFGEVFLGLTIIGVKYALLLAFLTSIVDALPVLGTGTVLIPWGLYEMLIGDLRLGISLLIIYVIVVVIRQLIEPKILSQQIGVYPLVTLMAMYAGLKLFGVLGLIFGPITVLVLKNVIEGLLKDKPIKDIFNKITPNTNNK